MSAKPRIVENSFSTVIRFPTTSTPTGTATTVSTTEDGGLNGLLQCLSGAAGRAIGNWALTLVANQWYCFSFVISDFNNLTAGGDNNGVKFAFTGRPDNGTTVINEAIILAGGVGRYCMLVMDTAGGAVTFQYGVGLDGDETGDLDITFKDFMYEPVTLTKGGFPSEWVYPGNKAAYAESSFNKITTNFRVLEERGVPFEVEKGNVVLFIGDSRSDEGSDIPAKFTGAMGDSGVGLTLADAGWTTTHAIGPTSVAGGFISVTSAGAIAGEHYHITTPDDDATEISKQQTGQMLADVGVVTNIGVNDINGGSLQDTTSVQAIKNIETICGQMVAAGVMPCITEITPWNAAATFDEATGERVQTYYLNQKAKELANANGWIFVPLYSELADSTDPDKLSDGGGSTPDYSTDGLHQNEEGSRLISALIKSQVEIWRQRVASGQ